MRRFIDMKFVKELDFPQSQEVFDSGGAIRPVFFYKDKDDSNNHTRSRTYIAFANTGEPEKEDSIQYITSGERGLSIVLKAVKADFSVASTDNTLHKVKILIPLQQINKAHWTLLVVEIQKSNNQPENGKASITATHYDSKSALAGNFLDNFWNPQDKEITKKTVKDIWKVKTAFINLNSQGISDHHNCGRYTLQKLTSLIDPKDDLSIGDINKTINREE